MVAGRHNLTRRALLGAAASVPLAGLCGAAPYAPTPLGLSLSKPDSSLPRQRTALRQAQGYRECSDRQQKCWSRALAAFRRAEARLAAFRRYEDSLPAAARSFPACAPLEERSDELESARLDAVRRLLRSPACDLPALALKVALAVDEEIAFFPGGGLCLAAVKADVERLCNG